MDQYQHKFVYDEATRRKRQNPEHILSDINLKTGMCFIDIGCNDGFFTLPAARMVGPIGKVIAIDIDGDALDRLNGKLQVEGITNTEVVRSTAEAIRYGQSCADIIFFGTVLHDFFDPLTVLMNSKYMLKESGFIYNFDWRKQDSKMGPPFARRLSQDDVTSLARQAGLTVTHSIIIDDNFYAVTLTR